MRWLIFTAGMLLGVLMMWLYSLFGGPDFAATYGASGVHGKYGALVDLKPVSLRVAKLDVYEDFGCPACQRFHATELRTLLQHYGDRLEVHHHYVASPHGPVSAKILYDVASDRGLAEPVSADLMRAGLSHDNDEHNIPVLIKIARSHGLEDSFIQARVQNSSLDRIKTEWEMIKHKVAFFPFVVVEGQIVTNGEPANLRTILDSLLVPPDTPSE